MRYRLPSVALAAAALAALPAPSQQSAPASQTPAVKANVEEVLLDMVVRDKKGKPVTDLKQDEITVSDDGAKQTLTSFRLVRGTDAVSSSGASAPLDPLRQVRLVTLAFEALGEVDQRRLARSAALDLIKGEQGTNVYFSVVVINTRLLVLRQFTNDRNSLAKAIELATGGLAVTRLASESTAIEAELRRTIGQTANGADQSTNLLTAAQQAAGQPVADGSSALNAKLASVMLNMLRMDQGAQSQDTRLSLTALKSVVIGQHSMPGRKSVLYFTTGLYVTPELDVPLRNLMSLANRDNVTFYSVDTRGVMTASLNAQSMKELNSAAAATKADTQSLGGGATKDEILASDKAETSGRANTQIPLRDLAEATGGFLIGDSNDLRAPLKRVNEEIAAYYEVSYAPRIQNYDGSFRKVTVSTSRKDVVIHARNGYFALPPEARAAGLQTFELPLLKVISDGKLSEDVKYRAGAVLLQPKPQGTDLSILMEIPLHELQPQAIQGKNMFDVHCSFAALVKNASGEVVEKVTRDRSFQVTPDQLKLGNLLDKTTVTVPPGKYTLESAVMDRQGGKVGAQRVPFEVAAKKQGVAISSLAAMRGYTPNAKGLDANEPFQFQGGAVTPTLDPAVKKAPGAMLRLFFTVYKDTSIAGEPAVEVEFLQNGKSLTKVPMQLPPADAQGRIPYLMTIPAESIPPGSYEIRAVARQGQTSSEAKTTVNIEAM